MDTHANPKDIPWIAMDISRGRELERLVSTRTLVWPRWQTLMLNIVKLTQTFARSRWTFLIRTSEQLQKTIFEHVGTTSGLSLDDDCSSRAFSVFKVLRHSVQKHPGAEKPL